MFVKQDLFGLIKQLLVINTLYRVLKYSRRIYVEICLGHWFLTGTLYESKQLCNIYLMQVCVQQDLFSNY